MASLQEVCERDEVQAFPEFSKLVCSLRVVLALQVLWLVWLLLNNFQISDLRTAVVKQACVTVTSLVLSSLLGSICLNVFKYAVMPYACRLQFWVPTSIMRSAISCTHCWRVFWSKWRWVHSCIILDLDTPTTITRPCAVFYSYFLDFDLTSVDCGLCGWTRAGHFTNKFTKRAGLWTWL